MWFNRLCIWSSLKTTRLHWRHLAVYTSFNAGCSRCGWRNLWVRWGAWCPDGWGPKFQTWQGEVLKAGESICLFERIGQSWKINENHIRIYIYHIYQCGLVSILFFTPFPIISKDPQCLGPKSNISNTFIYIPRLGVFDLIGRGWVGIVNGALQ